MSDLGLSCYYILSYSVKDVYNTDKAMLVNLVKYRSLSLNIGVDF